MLRPGIIDLSTFLGGIFTPFLTLNPIFSDELIAKKSRENTAFLPISPKNDELIAQNSPQMSINRYGIGQTNSFFVKNGEFYGQIVMFGDFLWLIVIGKS